MDGVLEGAAVLCGCKLACSLLFLPTLSRSFSPVSFCCCCLLVFTDVLVAVFLTLLYVLESWLPRLSSRGDVIALRFLLFLSHTWQWKVEELWAAACLHTTNSLIRCLPNLFNPTPRTLDPCWVMAFLSLLLFLTVAAGLIHQAQAAQTCREKHGVNINSKSVWQDLVPKLSVPSKPASPVAAESVDPEKTDSSCGVHRTFSWNSMKMSARHYGDFVLISPECLTAESGGQRTKRGIPLTYIIQEHMDAQCRSPGWRQWGFPYLNVMIGFVGVLSIFVLPLNLSVNIFLIRTIEAVLESCIKSLISSAENTVTHPSVTTKPHL
ncbi:hypothetical protein LDENG_00002250 [Lucifuga dentata]|nr:hypothetical protein LDENG_00002250 [Lucifuga dentata]